MRVKYKEPLRTQKNKIKKRKREKKEIKREGGILLFLLRDPH